MHFSRLENLFIVFGLSWWALEALKLVRHYLHERALKKHLEELRKSLGCEDEEV